MSVLHYPGMVLVLVSLAFLVGMFALYVRLPQALWQLAGHIGRAAGRALAATRQRARRPPRPLARPALRDTFPLFPWRSRLRIVVLIADPIARRARTDQLRNALADLLRAHPSSLPGTLTVEVASEARRRGTAYVAYLDCGRAPRAVRIRLAAFAHDGRAIDVDAQHTHLADLLPYLDDDPAATFVGLPAADPSSPIVMGSPTPPPPDTPRQEAARHGGAIGGISPTLPTALPSPEGGARRPATDIAHPEPAPIDLPGDADPDIPYGDHDAPAA